MEVSQHRRYCNVFQKSSPADILSQGIIRCDMIAEAIIGAAESFKEIPVVVRLQGTNSAEGQKLDSIHGYRYNLRPTNLIA